MSHFGLRSSEQLVLTAVCDRSITSDITGKTSCVPGRIFIFTNWMVWHGTGDGIKNRRWDLCFLLHKVLSASGNGAVLTMKIDTSDETVSSTPRSDIQTPRSNLDSSLTSNDAYLSGFRSSRLREQRKWGNEDIHENDEDTEPKPSGCESTEKKRTAWNNRVQIEGADAKNQHTNRKGEENSKEKSKDSKGSGSTRGASRSFGESALKLVASMMPSFARLSSRRKQKREMTIDLWEDASLHNHNQSSLMSKLRNISMVGANTEVEKDIDESDGKTKAADESP